MPNDQSSMALTQVLGESIRRAAQASLSGAACDLAREAFLDTTSVLVAGLAEPAVRLLYEARLALGENPQVASPAMAAVLATAAHALDYDDVAFGGHPSAVIVPAILVTAMLTGRSDGMGLLRAYVAGYETWAEIASREPRKYHAKGLHPTGLLGPFAAAAASAALLELPADKCSAALSLAGSASAGLLANFGSMAKPLHAGRACAAGVESAFLARGGYSAASNGLEASGGFLQAYSPSGSPDLYSPLRAFGAVGPLMLERDFPSVKRYPVCYAGHRCIDAAISLREEIEARGGVERVSHVVAHLSQRNSDILRFRRPSTASEARFSLEYFIACALDSGNVGLLDLSAGIIRQPGRVSLMERTERHIEAELDPEIEGFAKADYVEVVFSDGSSVTSDRIRRAKGHADAPLTRRERIVKADDCLANGAVDTHRRTWFIEEALALGKSDGSSGPWMQWIAGQMQEKLQRG